MAGDGPFLVLGRWVSFEVGDEVGCEVGCLVGRLDGGAVGCWVGCLDSLDRWPVGAKKAF
jgi:hypothetical protein